MSLKDLNDLQYEKLDNFTLLLDETTTANKTYVGKASPGTATSTAAWQIMVVDETGDLQVKWASGSDTFTQVWDNRSSLSYS